MDNQTVFDAHFHIIDPQHPLVRNQGYLPEPFTCREYRDACTALGLLVGGGAVVSGSFQAFDQGYLLAALAELGPGFVGVTQLPASVSDARIFELHAAGVRAVRFNLKRGGSEDARHLASMAQRVHELVDWHVELYVDSSMLAELLPTLLQLPRVSIDHLGLSRSGFTDLLRLVEAGVAVKATGFSRTDMDVAEALRAICAVNPQALMFGTDLPCTRAPRPFAASDLQLLQDALPANVLAGVLRENARHFYRLDAALTE